MIVHATVTNLVQLIIMLKSTRVHYPSCPANLGATKSKRIDAAVKNIHLLPSRFRYPVYEWKDKSILEIEYDCFEHSSLNDWLVLVIKMCSGKLQVHVMNHWDKRIKWYEVNLHQKRKWSVMYNKTLIFCLEYDQTGKNGKSHGKGITCNASEIMNT